MTDDEAAARAPLRLLIDTLGAPAQSGGMRLYGGEVLEQWLRRTDPADDLVVVGGPWVREVPGIERARRVVVWPNSNPVLRMVGQHLITPSVYLGTRRTRLLAINCLFSALIPARRATVVAHDWRHLSNPDEFSRTQRLYRAWWRHSGRRAGRVVCVSEKTRIESEEILQRSDLITIENGRDHPLRWTASRQRPHFLPTGPHAVTFGHHTNKRPELVVAALSQLGPSLNLVVLGATGQLAEQLLDLARATGVESRLALPGFVSDEEYRWVVMHASAVVLASSDEGFGLPLAEAQSLGIPAVVTRDSGVADLFQGAVAVTDPDPASIASALQTAVAALERPRRTTSGNTWATVVTLLRGQVAASGQRRRIARGGVR